jgi:hypothetical protein
LARGERSRRRSIASTFAALTARALDHCRQTIGSSSGPAWRRPSRTSRCSAGCGKHRGNLRRAAAAASARGAGEGRSSGRRGSPKISALQSEGPRTDMRGTGQAWTTVAPPGAVFLGRPAGRFRSQRSARARAWPPAPKTEPTHPGDTEASASPPRLQAARAARAVPGTRNDSQVGQFATFCSSTTRERIVCHGGGYTIEVLPSLNWSSSWLGVSSLFLGVGIPAARHAASSRPLHVSIHDTRTARVLEPPRQPGRWATIGLNS